MLPKQAGRTSRKHVTKPNCTRNYEPNVGNAFLQPLCVLGYLRDRANQFNFDTIMSFCLIWQEVAGRDPTCSPTSRRAQSRSRRGRGARTPTPTPRIRRQPAGEEEEGTSPGGTGTRTSSRDAIHCVRDFLGQDDISKFTALFIQIFSRF